MRAKTAIITPRTTVKNKRNADGLRGGEKPERTQRAAATPARKAANTLKKLQNLHRT